MRFVAPPPAPPAPAPPRPEGELACRAHDAFGVTAELWIAWSPAGTGQGTLRELTPSGIVRDAPLRVEREGQVVVADDARSPADLIARAATWTTVRGKGYMRRGGRSEPWSPCS